MGSLIVIAWKGGGRFTGLETSVEFLKDKVKDLKIDIDNVRNQAFRQSSPVVLTDNGKKWLLESGIKQYIDSRRQELLTACAIKKETNAYEVQQHIFNMFAAMQFDQSDDNTFKQYAYEQGISMDVLRRIGAIYLRDICLEEFKMHPRDIDKNKPKSAPPSRPQKSS